MHSARRIYMSIAFQFIRLLCRVVVILSICACVDSSLARAGCATFSPGVQRGIASIRNLNEASGIATSRRNPGILWTSNDGAGREVYALGSTGRHLATFYLNRNVIDKEDLAVGPGPNSELSYLYVGDIGGNDGRRQVQVLRIPEPLVDSGWVNSPRSQVFSDVDSFTLTYPDGAYDAESLMVDPISTDVFVVTKGDLSARVYSANLTNLPNGSTVILTFVRAIPFARASGGDISADGTLLVLRRENLAKAWERDPGESVDLALSRTGHRIPVMGQPREENGEGIALLPNGMGYITISEGENPAIYFFRARCPSSPEFTTLLEDEIASLTRSVTFRVKATGYPQPQYRWFFNGQLLPGKRRNVLVLANLRPEQAGDYAATASNRYGKATSTATLTLAPP